MSGPLTASELRRHALRLGIHTEVIRMRLRSGWTVQDAISVGHEKHMSTPQYIVDRWLDDPWETIKALAKANRVPFKTARSRFHRGEQSICEICSRRPGLKKPSSVWENKAQSTAKTTA